jgi:hypothetical protein
MEQQLSEIVKEFVARHRLSCAESIYQTDGAIEAAYEFIERLCDVVGYYQEDTDD